MGTIGPTTGAGPSELYEHPAIRLLNHEAKGLGARLPRLITRLIPTRVFGQRHSGPSYIDSGTFALGLLETLGINQMVQKLTVQRLKLRFGEMLAAAESETVQQQLRSSLQAYESGAMTLDALVDQAGDRIRAVNESVFEAHFADSSQRPFLMQQLSVKVVDILQASYLYLSLSWRASLCRRALQLAERKGAVRGVNSQGNAQSNAQSNAKLNAQVVKEIRS